MSEVEFCGRELGTSSTSLLIGYCVCYCDFTPRWTDKLFQWKIICPSYQTEQRISSSKECQVLTKWIWNFNSTLHADKDRPITMNKHVQTSASVPLNIKSRVFSITTNASWLSCANTKWADNSEHVLEWLHRNPNISISHSSHMRLATKHR